LKNAAETPLWIFCGPDARDDEIAALEDRGARVFRAPIAAGRLRVRAIVEALASEGMTRLLVEGGPEVWRSFAAAGLVDAAVVFHARVNGYDMNSYEQSVQNAVKRYLSPAALHMVEGRRTGDDTMWFLRRNVDGAARPA
jgi:diaminohydroxyphosphoribosylaminopyrimidine deaminase/5-amino-6-(5-phosphoribosylamino)uracil reductase